MFFSLHHTVSPGSPESRGYAKDLGVGSLFENVAPGNRLQEIGEWTQEGKRAKPRILVQLATMVNICYLILRELGRNLTKRISRLASLRSKVKEAVFSELLSLSGQDTLQTQVRGHTGQWESFATAAVWPEGKNKGLRGRLKAVRFRCWQTASAHGW